MSEYDNPLIFGKDKTERVVSIEIEDEVATLFIQDENGNVKEKQRANRFWILAKDKLSKNFIKLGGDLNYKYGKQYKTKEDHLKAVNYYKRNYRDIYNVYDNKEAFMLKDGVTYFKGLKPKEVTCLSFDIETTGLYHNDDSKLLLISNTFRKNGVIKKRLFCYDDYLDEGEMIEYWCEWVRKMDPSILLGHNIVNYDLPYIKFIAEKYNVELNLGRDDSILWFSKRPSKFRVDGSRDQEYHKVHCYGREVIDTYMLAIKYDIGRKYESYGLKSIIKAEGLEKENRTHYDSSQIRFNYSNPEEWKKIKDYCRDDSDDSLALFDLMIPAYFYMTQCIPKKFQAIIESASGSQLNSMMVRSYLQDGHSIPKTSSISSFQGALSAGIPGVYKNVLKWDVVSEYPSIILTYQVYDEDKDPKKHLIVLTSYFFKERLKYKKLAKETGNKQYEAMQNSFKTLLNSLYGFLGTPGINFNFPEGAAFVTEQGREIVNNAIKWATSKSYDDWVVKSE